MKGISKYLIIAIILLLSCNRKESSVNVAVWNEKPDTTKYERVKYVEEIVHTTYTSEYTDSSYWFFVMKLWPEEGRAITYHRAIAFPHPYFDFIKARKSLDGGSNKKGYVDELERISREAYYNWVEFKRLKDQKY